MSVVILGDLRYPLNNTLLFGPRSESELGKRVRQSQNITFVVEVDIEEHELFLLYKWVSPFSPLALKRQHPS